MEPLSKESIVNSIKILYDRRRFEAELPNDIWQSDVMHGPRVGCDGKLKKTYLIAFIDDHSRFVPFAGFFYSENADTFIGAFEAALSMRGLPRKLYVDNGAAFRSKKLEYATADLGISLVHAKPYQPQGKGKIERFFRTVRSRFLPHAESDDLISLSDSLKRWLEGDYHLSKHGSTGETPEDRYFRHIELLRAAPDDLMRYFRSRAKRKVTTDRIVSLDGKLFEAPVDLIGEKVDLMYHKADMVQIEVSFKGKSYGFIKQVDTGVNVRTGRGKCNEIVLKDSSSNPEPKEENSSTKPKGGKLNFSSSQGEQS